MILMDDSNVVKFPTENRRRAKGLVGELENLAAGLERLYLEQVKLARQFKELRKETKRAQRVYNLKFNELLEREGLTIETKRLAEYASETKFILMETDE